MVILLIPNRDNMIFIMVPRTYLDSITLYYIAIAIKAKS